MKFGLIGCGRIGRRHAEHIINFGELMAVCDVDEAKATDFANSFSCMAYTDASQLLNNHPEIDVISICSPNGLHATHSIAASRRGFHVLCEKPMALNVIDCGKMIMEAERANRRLFVVKQNRFNPPVARLKEMIEKDILGKISSIQLSCFWNRNKDYYENSWKGTLELDGGTLFTQFSHFIDLLYWIFGDVSEVTMYRDNFSHKEQIEFEDTGVAVLRFTSGTIGTINYTVNAYGKNMEGSLTIFGERGTIKIGGQYLNELEYQNIQNYVIEDLPQGNKANEYGQYTGSMSNHDLVYRNLIDVLENNAPIMTNAFEGMKTVEIIEKLYRSSK